MINVNELVNITINGSSFSVPGGITVLEAAKMSGVYIPTLCAMEGLKPKAACGLCAVKIDGEEKDKLACVTKVKDGMVITTDNDELFAKRKSLVQEMFRQHRVDCHHCLRIGSTKARDFDPKFCRDCYFCDCVRDGFCELQAKALEFGIDELPFEVHEHDFKLDLSTGSIIRDPNKCIKCRRCTEVCAAQGVGILGMVKTDKGQTVGAKNSLMADGCIRCGRCITVCPTGALFMLEHKDEEIYFAHQYGTKTAALLCSCLIPELEDLFGAPRGSIQYEQLVDGLKKIGIDHVYSPAAPKYIARQHTIDELDRRLGEKCLIMTDDFAGKNFIESRYPELMPQLLYADSKERVFGEYMREHFPDVKLYLVADKNSFGAEAHETGCVDYFLNARELYRVFSRCGVDPLKRRREDPEEVCEFKKSKRYGKLFKAGKWSVSGEIEEFSFEENGRTYSAVVCSNPGQLKKAFENMDKYDVIKIMV